TRPSTGQSIRPKRGCGGVARFALESRPAGSRDPPMPTGSSIFQRHPENPIVVPGQQPWRMATVFNPGAIYENGKFYLFERAAGSLRPFICQIGLLESSDGVHFELARPEPVF